MAEDVPTAQLLRQLSDQMTTLVQQEAALAKAEASEKGKQAGVAAGAFGSAGVVALYAVGALVAAVIALLATAVATWLAAAITAAGLALVAGALAVTGRGKLKQATPAVPEQAMASLKEDTDTIKRRAQEGRGAA